MEQVEHHDVVRDEILLREVEHFLNAEDAAGIRAVKQTRLVHFIAIDSDLGGVLGLAAQRLPKGIRFRAFWNLLAAARALNETKETSNHELKNANRD
jgi:hypothetical protein